MPAPPPDSNADEDRDSRNWGQWTGVGFEFGAAVFLFFFLGSRLDATWGTRPWMQVTGALLGIVVGTYLLVKQALRSEPTEKPPRDLKRP